MKRVSVVEIAWELQLGKQGRTDVRGGESENVAPSMDYKSV